MDIDSFVIDANVEQETDKAYYFIFNENKILIQLTDDQFSPLSHNDWLSMDLIDIPRHYFGSIDRVPCFAMYHPEEESMENFEWVDMRRIMVESGNDLFAIAGRGKQVLEFIRTHQFCGVCGQPTRESDNEVAMQCRACGTMFYPRLSPCGIVLVTRGEELLLARGTRLPEGMFTTLAGFVEAGETLEQCIHREVYEEVRIKVKNTQYFSSQAWPFPHQLMVGFFAEYDSGELTIDGKEISDARWWRYTDLPRIPPRGTISNSLINDYVSRLKKNN